jgi:segregation and condensation protein A
MLAEIKSRMLLPRPVEADDEEDPRAELVRRLQEYERYKQAAEDIDALQRLGRDVFATRVDFSERPVVRAEAEVSLREMLVAFKEVLAHAEKYAHHQVEAEPLSLRQRMSDVLAAVNDEEFRPFTTLFNVEEGRMGVVVTFLALLELIRESLIEIVQIEPYAPIHVKAGAGRAVEEDSDE